MFWGGGSRQKIPSGVDKTTYLRWVNISWMVPKKRDGEGHEKLNSIKGVSKKTYAYFSVSVITTLTFAW